jgi:hypothetical protein
VASSCGNSWSTGRAVALTRYEIQQPGKPEFTSDVAEVFSVKDDTIDSLAIYFDTAPYR